MIIALNSLLLLTIPFTGQCSVQPLQLKSPSGTITVTIFKENNGIFYNVTQNGRPLLAPAPLGLRIDGTALFDNTAYPVLQGKAFVTDTLALLKDHYQAKQTRYLKYQVRIGTAGMEFAVFDNGCAFRYKLPGNGAHLLEEQTGFTLDPNSRAWFFERTNSWKLKSYAGLWMQTRADSLDKISPVGPVQGKPVIVECKQGGYLFITEAALYGFSGMRLKATGNRLTVDFTEGPQGFILKKTADAYSPWRVIGFAKDLNALVNHSMIATLNPAPDPADFKNTAYIKPGRSVWSWITKDDRYLDPDFEKQLISAAAALAFEYTLIDDGWEQKWNDKWTVLKELVAFGKTKKVGVWVWKDSKFLRDSSYRDAFLDTLQQLGVAGIKIDFMNSEAQELIDFETAFLKAAAQRKLMVNFHGCQTSTGTYRTYPNELTREGIRGMELNIMNEPIPAWHNAALPFTRFITGPGDYTPGLFSKKGATTNAHQLALLYLMESPFQCIAENPLTLLSEPRFKVILPLLRKLPVTWDERVVLSGSRIGQAAIIAKRNGKDWYIAAVNGQEKAITQTLDLSFIKDRSAYRATLIKDQDDGFSAAVLRPEQLDKTTVTLQPSGGMVLYLEALPAKESGNNLRKHKQ
ncbi:glycoside hydrolase family 97 catalytic domain-containing protein [Niabella pedocola]|uniref:Glycoside hydrolase family 97 catalytic domain-containing protein n=1 Tax=Niabella pedocola TaxID=1752077 RepID=A0ABS8PT97_9BACT|nr:glycoside hydrolase family 97 protein [Niabella pedocola]MCD2424287.1 glycoside hydrolase family 97 catalytic domain-containing protein [Niabella pedocola]